MNQLIVKNNVLIATDKAQPTSPGAHYCLRCLTGPNKGKTYFLRGKRVVIGRGNECDIQLMDSKSSREHAELTKFGGNYILSDLKSQNGVIVNDMKIKQKTLEAGDQVIIASTVFKYDRVKIDEVKESISNTKDSKSIDEKNPKKVIIYASIVILLAALFTFDDTSTNKATNDSSAFNVETERTDFISRALKNKREEEDREMAEKLDVIFAKGMREFREKNYFRAIEEFQLALVISPQNSTAQFYLERAKAELNKEIEISFANALRDKESLRFNNAIVSYCNIIRLLQNIPTDNKYKKAESHLRDLEKVMGMRENEINCLQR